MTEGLKIYARSLQQRIEASEKLIEQTQWWLDAQQDYGITDIEGEETLRSDLAMYRTRRDRDKGYLAVVQKRLARFG